MKTLKSTLVLILITIFFIGCKKEGEPGPAGKDGKNGNANVKSTTLVANSTSNWSWNSGGSWREAVWANVSILDNDVVSYGAVMLYQEDGFGGYFALPATITYGGKTENDWFTYGPGSIGVVIQNTNSSDPISQIVIPTRYKLVVIPSAARLSNPDINLLNYNEVKLAFGLTD